MVVSILFSSEFKLKFNSTRGIGRMFCQMCWINKQKIKSFVPRFFVSLKIELFRRHFTSVCKRKSIENVLVWCIYKSNPYIFASLFVHIILANYWGEQKNNLSTNNTCPEGIAPADILNCEDTYICHWFSYRVCVCVCVHAYNGDFDE